MIFDEASCCHEWRYSRANEAHSTIVFKHSYEFCGDVVEEFANYLAAVGFHSTNIIEAFETYAITYGDAMQSACKRFRPVVVEEGE